MVVGAFVGVRTWVTLVSGSRQFRLLVADDDSALVFWMDQGLTGQPQGGLGAFTRACQLLQWLQKINNECEFGKKR